MQQIRCTAKLLKEIGVKPASAETFNLKSVILGPWHANLIHINRRKCVLFVNDRTLLNFVVTDVDRKHIRGLRQLFWDSLACVLASEDAPETFLTRLANEYDEIEVSKSSDRSVLGISNDLAFHYRHSILEAGGVHSWQIPEIIKRMNRMPMHASTSRSMFPIDELRKLYHVAA